MNARSGLLRRRLIAVAAAGVAAVCGAGLVLPKHDEPRCPHTQAAPPPTATYAQPGDIPPPAQQTAQTQRRDKCVPLLADLPRFHQS